MDRKYLEFASHLHFFEFLEEEFNPPHFEIENFEKEIDGIVSGAPWTEGKLSEFIQETPSSYEIFQEIFQLRRFTNVQIIEFLFDTQILNGLDKKRQLEYLKKNLENDKLFSEIFLKLSKKANVFTEETRDLNSILTLLESKDPVLINYLILLSKMCVVDYNKKVEKDPQIIHARLSNKEFLDVSYRFARYLTDNLKLNNILPGLNLKEFLINKRIPRDTKSIHGNFGKTKISEILEKHGFLNGDSLLSKELKTLPVNQIDIPEIRDRFVFATERYVEGVCNNKNKPKLFDFILIYNKPQMAIETNFYSTAGTKIGINEDEYRDLDNSMKSKFKELRFLWITDGNYWLLPDGKNRFMRVYETFGDRLLNYNLFNEKLEEIKKELKET